ncbi:N-acetyltransferase [Bartonella sp. HY329]|uniref:GNAT family N-acetyltransferase n=1 Tax=unclassified Bartonella TaxID=2645622 RepID=UPI0021C95BFA|nr:MULTISPECIES: N-acetyltransferase [unclassified Bartonella]UXM95671.1 N-acetyltransferase [Bartonella sp. HY329]UXN09996.1 N-acetyltransferase [Bartonella sp. HY328]
MTFVELIYAAEDAAHNAIIENLNEEAFGPSRFTRAAHLIRESGGHDRSLSFVALKNNEVVGTIRQTPIYIGQDLSLLLGPIVISPKLKSAGIGKHLMNIAIEAARAAEFRSILLVGDEPYYGRFGFKKIPNGHIHMPAPVNPDRLLGLELIPHSLKGVKGIVRHKNCLNLR